jgi:hypothetical protein
MLSRHLCDAADCIGKQRQHESDRRGPAWAVRVDYDCTRNANRVAKSTPEVRRCTPSPGADVARVSPVPVPRVAVGRAHRSSRHGRPSRLSPSDGRTRCASDAELVQRVDAGSGKRAQVCACVRACVRACITTCAPMSFGAHMGTLRARGCEHVRRAGRGTTMGSSRAAESIAAVKLRTACTANGTTTYHRTR